MTTTPTPTLTPTLTPYIYIYYDSLGDPIYQIEADDMRSKDSVVNLYLQGRLVATFIIAPGQFVAQNGLASSASASASASANTATVRASDGLHLLDSISLPSPATEAK